MSDVLIVAKFKANAFFTHSDEEREMASQQARELFGDPAEPMADDVNWIYLGTPAGRGGGWVAIVSGESYKNFSQYLMRMQGALSKFYDFDILYLNRTFAHGLAGGEVTMLEGMVPLGSHSW